MSYLEHVSASNIPVIKRQVTRVIETCSINSYMSDHCSISYANMPDDLDCDTEIAYAIKIVDQASFARAINDVLERYKVKP